MVWTLDAFSLEQLKLQISREIPERSPLIFTLSAKPLSWKGLNGSDLVVPIARDNPLSSTMTVCVACYRVQELLPMLWTVKPLLLIAQGRLCSDSMQTSMPVCESQFSYSRPHS